MKDRRVPVFFYGLYMDFDVLRKYGDIPEVWEAARLYGYDFRIASWGFLTRSEGDSVYGTVVGITHEELERLYGPSNDFLTLRYVAEPVLVETLEGKWVAALCYVGTSEPEGLVNADYVDRMVALSERFGFPRWYTERLAAYRPT
jgi:hypothetical protein